MGRSFLRMTGCRPESRSEYLACRARNVDWASSSLFCAEICTKKLPPDTLGDVASGNAVDPADLFGAEASFMVCEGPCCSGATVSGVSDKGASPAGSAVAWVFE